MIRAALALLAFVGAICVIGLGGAQARPLPGAPNCPLFPPDNHWNLRVDRLPVHPRSAEIVRSIGLDEHVHAGS
jgi:hypothetical protein